MIPSRRFARILELGINQADFVSHQPNFILNRLDSAENQTSVDAEWEADIYESSPPPPLGSLDVSFSLGSDDSFDPNISDFETVDSSISIKNEKKELSRNINILNNVLISEPKQEVTESDNRRNQSEFSQFKDFTENISPVHQESQTSTDIHKYSFLTTYRSSMKKKKRTICKYCNLEVDNFERHLERNHSDEKTVQEFLDYPKKHKERTKLMSLLRNEANSKEYLKRNIRPKYSVKNKQEYYICSKCKVIIRKSYISRHRKICIVKGVEEASSESAASQTLIACALDDTNTIQKLRVKNEVFSRMKVDDISLIAKTYFLIFNFGENYLKNISENVCSNRMRELARFLIEFRKLTGQMVYDLSDILKPHLFDTAVQCAKIIAGYDNVRKTYRAPSLSAHLGTSLKQVCDLYTRLLLKDDNCVRIKDKEQCLTECNRFKKLVESQWTTELRSMALKDLNEKKWEKPMILPLTQDVLKFRDHVRAVAENAIDALKVDYNDKVAFRNLVNASFTLTVLFNRRRIGDVQYTPMKVYIENENNSTNQKECEEALIESERALAKYYKKVVSGGKESRRITILFPKKIKEYIDLFLEIRAKTSLVPDNNTFLFGLPGTSKWLRGQEVIRKFAITVKLEYPEQITSNKLRKEIATVMQILNLTKEETEQFAKFMGHTGKTHDEFYKLPQDVYESAKISKVLIMMERGATTFKGKALSEINIKPEEESDREEDETKDETSYQQDIPKWPGIL